MKVTSDGDCRHFCKCFNMEINHDCHDVETNRKLARGRAHLEVSHQRTQRAYGWASEVEHPSQHGHITPISSYRGVASLAVVLRQRCLPCISRSNRSRKTTHKGTKSHGGVRVKVLALLVNDNPFR